MTVLDKNTLKTNIVTSLPDNTDNLITPLDHRTLDTDQVDSMLNLAELLLQTVLGNVNFTGGIQRNGVDLPGLDNVSPNQIVNVNAAGDDIEYADVDINPVSREWTFQKRFITPGLNNFVFVGDMADYPNQTGTELILETGKIYHCIAPHTVTKFFKPQTNSLLTAGTQSTPNIITYSGTGSMFDITDVNFTISKIVIDSPTAQAFDVEDTVGGNVFIFIDNITLISATRFGTFDDMDALVITRSSAVDVDEGILLLGSSPSIFSLDKTLIASTGSTMKAIDFGTSVFQTLEIDNLIVVGPSGVIAISGLASSGNIAANRLATVSNCDFSLDVTPLENITSDDIRWGFSANNAIDDTQPDGLMSLNGNTTATVISAINTPVLVAGTWTCQRQSQFNCTAAGRFTHLGERDLTTPIDVILTIDPPAGDSTVAVYIALNGTVITDSAIKSFVKAGDPGTLSTMWQLKMPITDFIEVFVENQSGSDNITVTDAIFRVR